MPKVIKENGSADDNRAGEGYTLGTETLLGTFSN
jgi:hypothetical protein